MANFVLPRLPYGYGALAPHISEQIMILHHSKHHQAYVNNLNAALNAQASSVASCNLPSQVHLQTAIRFNAGGHINHSLFWQNLMPATSSGFVAPLPGTLSAALEKRWGSIDSFKAKFETVLLGIQGSGWGWLVEDIDSGLLDLVTTKDQDLVPQGKKPLLGIDMWEHAYYLQYLNNKKDYVTGIWHVVNWEVVEARLKGTVDAVYGQLAGLATT